MKNYRDPVDPDLIRAHYRGYDIVFRCTQEGWKTRAWLQGRAMANGEAVSLELAKEEITTQVDHHLEKRFRQVLKCDASEWYTAVGALYNTWERALINMVYTHCLAKNFALDLLDLAVAGGCHGPQDALVKYQRLASDLADLLAINPATVPTGIHENLILKCYKDLKFESQLCVELNRRFANAAKRVLRDNGYRFTKNIP